MTKDFPNLDTYISTNLMDLYEHGIEREDKEYLLFSIILLNHRLKRSLINYSTSCKLQNRNDSDIRWHSYKIQYFHHKLMTTSIKYRLKKKEQIS
jgi:hypothetical protein